MHIVRLLVCAGCLLFSARALAQTQETSFELQTFRLSPHGRSLLSTESGELPMGLALRFQVAFLYAFRPFEIVDTTGARLGAIVDHRLDAELAGSVSIFGRFSFGLTLPANLLQIGELTTLGVATGLARASLGDLRLSPKVGVLTEAGQGLGLALLLNLTLPTGNEGAFSGDRFLTFNPELALSKALGPVLLAFNFGYVWRQPSQILDLVVGQELVSRLGAGWSLEPLVDAPLELIGELFGRTAVTAPFRNGTTPVEWMLGVRWSPLGLVALTAGAGRGLVAGYGAPAVRAFVSLALLPIHEDDPPPPPAKDSDGDGLVDPDDQCPFEPEDKDGFQDADGCPDDDNDRDGVLDVSDACPNVAEDKDGFDDADGCPEDDNDADGIKDSADQCPNVAEDRDGFNDADGCPDPDNDADGLLDPVDACPNEAETVNGVDDDDGCPDKGRSLVVLAAEQIDIKDKVYFATNKAVLLPRSHKLLNQIANLLKNHAEVRLVRVEGHTDERSGVAYNQALSEQRAEAVRRYLVGVGIAAERLQSKGFGESKPVSTNKTKRGREANRRVAFVILERAEVIPASLEAAPAKP